MLQRVFIYDALATLAVFLMSVITRNSSCYDPYWSVAPVPIALYYAWNSPDGNRYRQAAVLVLIAAWGVRLTYNWAVEFLIKVGIAGQHKEDWRLVQWIVSPSRKLIMISCWSSALLLIITIIIIVHHVVTIYWLCLNFCFLIVASFSAPSLRSFPRNACRCLFNKSLG